MAENVTKGGSIAARIGLTVLVILALTAGVILIGFRVKNIEITGTRRISDATIEDLIHLDECHGNTLLLYLMNRKIDVSDIDMIEQMKVEITGPRSVRVNVEEQLLVGFFRIGDTSYYVNENGLVILTQNTKIEGVPEILGLEISNAVQGDYLSCDQMSALEDLLQIAAIIQETELSVETLEMTEDGHYTVAWQNIKALLGRNVYMNEKIGELKSLQERPEVAGQSGTFHLEEYDATKDTIIFRKD